MSVIHLNCFPIQPPPLFNGILPCIALLTSQTSLITAAAIELFSAHWQRRR